MLHVRESLRALALLVLVATGACARPLVVKAPVLYPARVPVRAYPSIWVVGGALPEGDLGERLRAHIAHDAQTTTRRLEVKELEPLRESGSIPPLTLVVILEPSMYSDVQSRWEVVPVRYCDYYWGCFTDYQNVYSTTPQVVGEVVLTVYDGPTARVLQKEHFQSVSYERNTPRVRAQLLEQLATQLERSVDVLKSEARFELEPVDEIPAVRQALADIQAGRWEAGRSLLEQAALQLDGLSHEVQARVWYDLAIARWQAPGPGGLTRQAYEAAKRALDLAVAREQSGRYRGALERLELARQREAILEEQRRAREHNFAMAPASAPPAASPTPPAPPVKPLPPSKP